MLGVGEGREVGDVVGSEMIGAKEGDLFTGVISYYLILPQKHFLQCCAW